MVLIKKRTCIITTLLICLVASTVSFGATHKDFHRWFQECFKISNAQLAQQTENKSILKPAVTEKGVTVEIKDAIVDTQGIYVVYEMITPSQITLTDDIQFQNTSIGLDGNHYDLNKKEISSTSEHIIAQTENKRTVLLQYIYIPDAQSNQIELQFSNLGRYTTVNGVQSFETLIEGEWQMNCLISSFNSIKKIAVDKDAVLLDRSNSQKKKIHVTDIALSPISLSVQYSKMSKDSIRSAYILLNKKDGTTFICGKDSVDKLFFGTANGGTMYFRFPSLLDIEDIESITVGDIIITM